MAGREAAAMLLALGWHVIGIGRDPARTAAAEAQLRAVAADVPGARIDMIRADLSRIAEADRAAEAIAQLTDRVDVLLNNAGGMATAMVVTPEGLEENFAGNHLGPFRLTQRLVRLLRRAAAGAPPGSVRIVNTASDGSEMIPALNWDDLQLLDGFDPGRAYCQGKLANVLHARGLAARLAGDGIVAHAVHPGTVASNFVAHVPESTRAHIATLAAMSPRAAADALVWLATADEPGRASGGYYHQHRAAAPNPFALDDANVDRLWTQSEALVAAAAAA